MRIIRKIKDLKYNIKYKFQKAKKGYCDEDLFCIHDWFINIFPKMLKEFAEHTVGSPMNEEILLKEASNMPKLWIEEQKPIVDKLLDKYNCVFDLNDRYCCWLLIILRMKYCFEMCNEWNINYKSYWENQEYEKINKKTKKYKNEAFYLFKKWFYALWW